MSTATSTFELSSLDLQDHQAPTLDDRQTSLEEISRIQAHTRGSSVEVQSKGRAAVIITTVAGVNFLNVMGSGILTVALPTMAKDLDISTELLLWLVVMALNRKTGIH